MTSTEGEHRVEGGLWWNAGTWTVRSVPVQGGTLPETGAPWRRVPGWLLFPLAPVVGGAFVVALPLVGAFLVVQEVARRVLAGGGRAARDLAATVAAPSPRTGEAHLTGAPGAEPTTPAGAEPLDEVEADVRGRKAQEQPPR